MGRQFLLVFLISSGISVNGNTLKAVQEPVVVVDPMKFVPLDFIESYKGFASDIVANEIFVEHSNTFGASAAYTFGIGHLLAVVNEKMFNIPSEGFDEALRTKLGAVTTAYKDMTESLEEDSNVRMTSTIYTSNRSLEATEGVKALRTNVFYQDFSQPHVVVPTVNARIAIQTYSKIYDKLIPKGGWYGPSIYSFTKGIFANTFFYKNKFLYPFIDIGKEFFVTDRVRMLATAGNFRIRKTSEFTTITLPFQDKRKSLVLVMPKGDLRELSPYLDEALDSTKTDGFIETKPLIVQLPALNFSVSNEYFSQLFYMGVNNTMCNWNEGNPYFMQPVAQALYFYLDSDKFEVASATGAQINNNREFQETTGIKQNKPIIQIQEHLEEKKDDENEFEEDTTSRFRSSIHDAESSEESGIPMKHFKFLDDKNVHAETIRFDKPFYWYLNDDVLGPVFVGVVNSFKAYKEQVVAVEEAFDDMFKYQFWSCSPKHLALIDIYNSAPEIQADEDEE